MKNTYVNLPKNIANRIKAKRLTHIEVADAMGVSRQTIANWTSGRRTPRMQDLIKLAEVLDCSVTDLTDHPSSPTTAALSVVIDQMDEAQRFQLLRYAKFILQGDI